MRHSVCGVPSSRSESAPAGVGAASLEREAFSSAAAISTASVRWLIFDWREKTQRKPANRAATAPGRPGDTSNRPSDAQIWLRGSARSGAASTVRCSSACTAWSAAPTRRSASSPPRAQAATLSETTRTTKASHRFWAATTAEAVAIAPPEVAPPLARDRVGRTARSTAGMVTSGSPWWRAQQWKRAV